MMFFTENDKQLLSQAKDEIIHETEHAMHTSYLSNSCDKWDCFVRCCCNDSWK